MAPPRARLVSFIIALMIVARALVPLGFMPNLAGGKIDMVICTINGPEKIRVDAAFSPVQKHSPTVPQAHESLCPFSSAIGWEGTLTPAIQIFILAIFILTLPIVWPAPLHHRRLWRLASSPRGPPVFSV